MNIAANARIAARCITTESVPMSKSEKVYYDWLGELSRHGWDCSKIDSVRFNSGSETAKHIHAKTATARVLRLNGYRVSSEVEHPERGEVDIVAIPKCDDQKPFAVELETSPADDVIADKLERYYSGTPFVECYVINVSELPLNILEMEQHIADELGLEI